MILSVVKLIYFPKLTKNLICWKAIKIFEYLMDDVYFVITRIYYVKKYSVFVTVIGSLMESFGPDYVSLTSISSIDKTVSVAVLLIKA